MITLEKHPEETMVELHVSGTLTREDYKGLEPELAPLLHGQSRLRCVVELHDFHGWKPGALMDELRFDARYRKQFGRMAVIGENRWEEWGTKFSGLFFPGEVRYFDQTHAEEAHTWVKELRRKIAETAQT